MLSATLYVCASCVVKLITFRLVLLWFCYVHVCSVSVWFSIKNRNLDFCRFRFSVRTLSTEKQCMPEQHSCIHNDGVAAV